MEKVRKIKEDGEEWYCVRDLLDILGMSKGSSVSWTSQISPSHVRNILFNTKGGPQSIVFTTLVGIKQIISKSRKPEAQVVAKQLGMTVYEFHFECKETSFIKVFRKVYPFINTEFQYTMNNSRVDLLLKEHKLIIEFDERYHDGKMQKSQDQSRVENILNNNQGFTVLRFKETEDIFEFFGRLNIILFGSKIS